MNLAQHWKYANLIGIASATALALLSLVNPVFASSSPDRGPIGIHTADTLNLKTWWQKIGQFLVLIVGMGRKVAQAISVSSDLEEERSYS